MEELLIKRSATVGTTDAEIDAAIEKAKLYPPVPQARSAEYNAELDVVVLKVDNGRRYVIPREALQGLGDATPAQLADIQIFGGTDIAWPQLDVDHYLPALMEGVYGSEKWMQHLEQVIA